MTPLDLSAYIALGFCYLFAAYVFCFMCRDIWRAFYSRDFWGLPSYWPLNALAILAIGGLCPWALVAIACHQWSKE